MTRTQGWILLVLVLLTAGSYYWITEYSSGLSSYRWFQGQLKQQRQINTQIKYENQRLRREITALRYDHRLIEREARDLLALTRKGEIVINLPR